MPILNFPVSSPPFFWIVALVWSAYQAFAGYQYGLWIYDNAYKMVDKNNNRNLKWDVRTLAYGLPHSAFYFLCSISGFVAWNLTLWVSERITNWSEISSGTGAILIALAVLSLLGVSGALPRILYLGTRPV
jgi:hypothetical protein